MSMTAPPLMLPMFESEPTAIKTMPMKIMANAMKNSQVPRDNCGAEMTGPPFVWHSEQDQLAGLKQLLHTGLPHSRQM